MSRRLLWLGLVVVALLAHAVVTDRETRDAEAQAGGKILELDSGDLNYRDQGDLDDPVLVLLHGFTASQRWWDRVAPDLVSRGLRVIRFDLLGHGGSEKPREGYALENQAQVVTEALERLKVRRATVVGHSMGGSVAAALVEAEPRLVRRVGVIGTAPRNGFTELPLTGRVAKWPVIGQLLRRIAPDQAIRAGLESAFAPDVEVPDAFVDDLDGMTYSAYATAGDAGRELNEERPSSERVKRSGRPLLVIFGTEDDLVDPDAARAWKRAIPRARVEVLDGAGHSPQWEQPREVVKLLLDFAR